MGMTGVGKGGLVRAAVVAGVLAAVVGCGGGGDEEPSAGSSRPLTPPPAEGTGGTEGTEGEVGSPSPTRDPFESPSETETETETETDVWPSEPSEFSEPTGPVRVTDGQTEPGTHLSFGRKAIVPFRYYDDLDEVYIEGVIGIVVERIHQIPGSHIEGNFDRESREVLNDTSGYYTRITITNESGDDLSNIGVPDFELRTTGGGYGDVSLIGGEARECPETYIAPESFDHEGARWVTCVTDASSAAAPLTEVRYFSPPYGRERQLWDDDPPPQYNEYYSLGAIVWS